MSHDTSHSFWMRAAVHLRLDLHDFPIFHIFSWLSLQLLASHPSNILSHPIFCCSSTNALSVCVGGSSLAHCWRYLMIVHHSTGSVPCSFSHLLNLVILSSHCVCALSAGHLSMCSLSSRSTWQQGHCADDLCPHHTIFFPCEKCLVICFTTHCLWPVVILLSAHSITKESRLSAETAGVWNLLIQYCFAMGPLNAALITCLWLFTILIWLIINPHGLKGIVLFVLVDGCRIG